MKLRKWLPIGMLLVLPVLADKAPVVHAVEPPEAHPGEVVLAKGVSLTKTHVAAVFVSDGIVDTEVEVVEQAAEVLKFKLPEDLRPGRYRLVLALRGNPPLLADQPVNLVVIGPIGEQ